MSIHIDAAVFAIVTQAVNDANNSRKRQVSHKDYRPFVEACLAAETTELRVQIAELKLANLILQRERDRLASH